VTRDGQEPTRALGLRRGRRDPHAPEPQHVLGFPADWFGSVDTEFFRSVAHPVKAYRRWARRRRLGAYAIDDDEPGGRD
jgi:hypothetical protein